MLEFQAGANFILASPPRVDHGTGDAEPVTTYQVMVLGFGRPRHIAVKVQGPPPRVVEGDDVEFLGLQGMLYRGREDPGSLSGRITFTAKSVARTQGRQIPEGVKA